MSLINCEDLSIGYNKSQIVEGLSFSVDAGDFLCIVGENGSGKSTLLKSLLGLNRPISGKIVFGDGLDCKKIGYLPQQTAVQRDFPASAYEIVLSGTLTRGAWSPFYTKKQKKLALDSMERLGIAHLKDRCFRELSGGQRQRVLLSRAICATERLIVLDEPVAALDADAAKEMYAAIESLNNDGIAVIMVSHDSEEAIRRATHVLHVSHRPKFFGTASDYAETDLYRKLISGGGKNA